jgi:isochorismate hydrolase
MIHDPFRLTDVERANIRVMYTAEQYDDEADDKTVMKEMWVRLANSYLEYDMRIDIGVWIRQDPQSSALLNVVQRAADRTVDLPWS